jgi:hypothetical protein
MGLVESEAYAPESGIIQPPLSDEELIRFMAEEGLRDIYYFETEILDVGKDDEFPRAEAEIRPLLEWFDQPRPIDIPRQARYLIYWSSPRFTAKTVSLATSICRKIIKHPNIAIMVMAELKEMAVATVDMVRNWLESPKIERCYGRFKAKKNWGSESFTIRQRTVRRRDPTLMASGMDVPMQGGHPDLLVWDDLVGESNNNPQGFKKVENRVAASMPVLRQGGIGIFNGTRWDQEDPAGKILQKAAKGEMWVAPKPRGFFGAYAVEGDEEFFPGLDVQVGEPLFETILPEGEIESYRRDWPYDLFSSQILNDPAPLEGRWFHRENYRYFEPFDEKGELSAELKAGVPYLAIDAAGGKETAERGDDTVIGVGFIRWLEKNPEMRVVDAVGGRWKTDKVVHQFFILFEKWAPYKCFIETNIGKQWLLDPLIKRARSVGLHLPYEEVNWGKGEGKSDRIKVLINPYQYHQILHAEHLKNSKLEHQQAQWREGGKVHDDWIDMEAMLWKYGTGRRKRPGSKFKVGSFNKPPSNWGSSRIFGRVGRFNSRR